MCSVARQSANQKEFAFQEKFFLEKGATQYASLETEEDSNADDLMEMAVTCAWLFYFYVSVCVDNAENNA